MARQITVDLVSDTRDFERSMRSAGDATDRLADDMREAERASSRLDDGMSRVNDGLGTSTERFRSVSDLAGGLGDVMGFSAAGPIAAYATGIADMADGLGGLLGPAMERARGAFTALNTVMRANPILTVVTVLALLTAAFVTAYKKSETFRNIVDGALKGVRTAFRAMWDAVSPIFGLWTKQFDIIRAGIEGVVGAIRAAWNAVLGGRTIGLPKVSIPFAPDFPGFSFTIPALADGGTAQGGRMHLVGERGPELFVPNMTGTVVPNHKLGGGNVTVEIRTGAGDLDELIRRRVRVLGGNVQTAFGSN